MQPLVGGSNPDLDDCTIGKALDNGYSVTISPDGTSVYVASYSSDAVAVFDREVPPVPPVPPTELSLTLKLSKHLSTSRLKAFKVSCDADCTATLRGRVRITIEGRGRAGASARKINMGSKSIDLIANQSEIVKFNIKRRGQKATKLALRRGHKVKAAVRARAKDADGIVAKTKVGVRLR